LVEQYGAAVEALRELDREFSGGYMENDEV